MGRVHSHIPQVTYPFFVNDVPIRIFHKKRVSELCVPPGNYIFITIHLHISALLHPRCFGQHTPWDTLADVAFIHKLCMPVTFERDISTYIKHSTSRITHCKQKMGFNDSHLRKRLYCKRVTYCLHYVNLRGAACNLIT